MAFSNCSSLTSITIPEKVTTIGGMAFSNCSSLTNVTIPETVTEIIDYAFSGCSNLTSITIPKGVTTIGEGAFNNCSNLTIYCYGNSYTEAYAKRNNIPYKLIGMVENPSITTTDIPKAVQYVPYSVMIENNNQDSESDISYSLKEGSLPDGMELKENGELYGVPKEVGEFTFTVIMEVDSDFSSSKSEKTYTLVVMKNTDETIDSSIDQGYHLIERVPDIDVNIVESQALVSKGEFSEFKDVYLDGIKLIRDEDYIAEEGSTKITIRSQTLTRVGEGTHTIALEFETNTGLKRVAQNYTVSSKNDNNTDNDNDSENEGNQDKDDINNGSDNNESNNNNSGNNSESNNQDESNDNSSDNENEVEDDTLNIYSEDLWVKDRLGWRYKKPNGAWLLHTWCKLPYKGTNEWYYFNEQGYMVTGWLKEEENWYYLNPLSDGTQGKMYIGWKLIDGNWYYFKEDGVLVTNTWYQLPYKETNEWYYFNEQGYMVTGWLKEGENWYYLNPLSNGTQGKMYTGWQLIDEKWYYFNEVSDGKKGTEDGSMATDTWIGDYYVDENGVWIEKQ